jgi:hypothetical protein
MSPENGAYKSIATMKVYLKRHATRARDISPGDIVLTGGVNFSLVVDVTVTDKYGPSMAQLKLMDGTLWSLRPDTYVLRKPTPKHFEAEMKPLIDGLPGISLIEEEVA